MSNALILVSEATTMWDNITTVVDAGSTHIHIECNNQLVI